MTESLVVIFHGVVEQSASYERSVMDLVELLQLQKQHQWGRGDAADGRSADMAVSTAKQVSSAVARVVVGFHQFLLCG